MAGFELGFEGGGLGRVAVAIEWTAEGYRVVGSKADATQRDRLAVIDEILPDQAPGWPVDEVRGAWPDQFSGAITSVSMLALSRWILSKRPDSIAELEL